MSIPLLHRAHPLLLSLATGLLLFAAWPVTDITPLIFVGFVPLLTAVERNPSKLQFIGLVYLAMFTWNLLTTWWIWNASPTGAAMAIVANSLLMSLPWLAYRLVQQRLGTNIGYASLVVFWLAFEYLHLLDWGLSWPWLTLGNVFATRTSWIQWYEFTGTSGGSLWIWIINLLVFRFIHLFASGNRSSLRKLMLAFPLLVVVPLLLSIWLQEKARINATMGTAAQVVVVQPNIDPYEKVSTGSFETQLQQLVQLTKSKLTDAPTLVVWPETALYSPNGFDETQLRTNFFLTPLFALLQQYPNAKLFTGIESYRTFNDRNSASAKPIEGTNFFYESYNGSVLLDSSGPLAFHHKSMLVPGVETLPRFLLFLGPVFEQFGGTTGGYTRQVDREPIKADGLLQLAPAICYESIYGNYMSSYFSKGANLTCIITNDGWWGNTPGHRQHQAYARLRAIETRKWVVRSANTGISCVIDPAGTVMQAQPWWTASAFSQTIYLSATTTFFVRFGDLISIAALLCSALLLIWVIVKKIKG